MCVLLRPPSRTPHVWVVFIKRERACVRGKVAPVARCFRAADWEWSGLNRGIIPQRLSFHPERRWRALVDNDISLWQTQAKRQIHVGRDGEKEERKRRTGQEVRELGRAGLFSKSAVCKSQ